MTMTVNEIKTIVSIQLGIARVKSKDRILEDLGAESADVVGIISALEDKYKIIIDEEEIPQINTVRDLYLLVHNKSESSIKEK